MFRCATFLHLLYKLFAISPFERFFANKYAFCLVSGEKSFESTVEISTRKSAFVGAFPKCVEISLIKSHKPSFRSFGLGLRMASQMSFPPRAPNLRHAAIPSLVKIKSEEKSETRNVISSDWILL